MPLPKPIPFTRYGGLILNRPLDEVGSDNAIDILDVDWGASMGTVQTREGAEAFSPEDAEDNYNALFPHSPSRLLARRGETSLRVLNGEGKEIESKLHGTSAKHLSFARMGTPSASYTYIADGEKTVARYDGTDFANPTATVDGATGLAMPKARFLTVWPDGGNRLVVMGTPANGGPNGAISSGSHVWFAKPGEAEGYESTAFVQLSPGDGEEFTGGCVWGGMVFVFKQTKLFVFYGVSADNDGKPVFNFREVALGTRIRQPHAEAGPSIVAGHDSVYFVSEDGVWVTTGAEPALLSDELEPLSRSDALPGPIAATLESLRWISARGIAYMNEAVYVGLGSSRLLKYDLRKQGWTIWSANLNCFVPWVEQTTERQRLFFSARGASHQRVYLYSPSADEDESGAAFTPRWQSGFYALDLADEKSFVHAKMWGTGNVDLKVAEDYKALGNATTFALGEAPAIAQCQKQKAQTATLFSHQLSGTAPWSVQRLDRYLRETRVPQTQKKG